MAEGLDDAAVLRVGSAFPDPPFNGEADAPSGLDVDLTAALARSLGWGIRFVPYRGADFDGIFAGLGTDYDCVASGTTITPARERLAAFGEPYLVSGQAIAVDVGRHPDVRGVDDLDGLVIGVQNGNTSEPIARRLVADGKAASLKVYAYDRIREAVSDLTSGACDVLMKLDPVLTDLVRPTPGVEVVARGLSVERVAVATRIGDPLGARLARAQAQLEADGTLARFRRIRLGRADLEQP
ncbi:amino acid ABC transporter substrate-binding protein, PAAT family (TC 3.A.1.3.-) [Microbacterium sp. cf046]|uniref:ABC transporter substrate-binding protein n=1 Tax=Microbacterium sp. cf046 TaxID=1761803 RepID=UPI0008EF3395|nr:ABC transporter substrate-binding protein [Microbacterium sp. cf046]SFS04134.1 amino acid ABC transporter substrate-binding protein, PAAT family (TC 3.A.1.3.-) [Microbacterium sp. cf046]